jgi:hypothetical protein
VYAHSVAEVAAEEVLYSQLQKCYKIAVLGPLERVTPQQAAENYRFRNVPELIQVQ